MAAAPPTRALPNLVTILAWRSCDHTGPVFEGDVLRTEVTVEGAGLSLAQGGMVDLARRRLGRPRRRRGATPVLDWRFVAVMA